MIKKTLFLVLILLLLPIKIHCKSKDTVSIYLKTAEKYFQNGEYGNAKLELRKILKINPKHRAALEYLSKINVIMMIVQENLEQGKKKIEEGKFAEAELNFREVLKFDKNNKKALFYIEELSKKGAIEISTVSISAEKITEAPKFQDNYVYIRLGIIEYKKGNYKKAIDYFTQVLSLAPKNEKAKKYLKRSADRLLEPERKAIEKERVQLVKEAQKALEEQQKRLAKRNKEINPLFKEAKKYYKKKWYLTSTDKFTEILLKYPEYQMAMDYYENIRADMKDIAAQRLTTDLEKLSYAKGYVSYYEQKLPDAVSEWEKTLRLNPKREELESYIRNVKEKLKDAGRLAKENELDEKIKRLFDEGLNNFNGKSWIGCIKKMENVQQICRDEQFPKSLDWHGRAQEYITKSVEELSKLAVRPAKPVVPEKPAEVEPEIDVAGAEKKYSEGLVLYAQGKLFDAVQKWGVAVSMNPNHEKARRAFQKAKKELEIQKK
ncbi:MAG: tetratricopeptide repeat protein [Elusimicrobia bacterium]|nr:tetratricopeptide repeat protein [Elusimicrobiota bacterium]